MKDKKKFKGFMMLIAERENRDISEALLEAYWETLKPFNDEQCEKAFKHVWNNTRFFPKPVDFLECLLPQRYDEIDFPKHVYLKNDRTQKQKNHDMSKLRNHAHKIRKQL